MKQVSKLAKAMQVLVVSLLVSMALVQGVYGIQITASGGSNGESGSVALNFNLAKDATVNSKLTIAGASIGPTTAIGGSISTFEQTHAVKDSTGKTASVSVKVVNAPNGLTYESHVLPGEGAVTVQPWVSAEQWLTVPNADSIECTSASSYGSWSADAGIKESKGSVAGDYVTLTGYYGRAYASGNVIAAEQTATDGSGNSINIFNHVKDGSELFSVGTNLNGIASGKAKFQGLTSVSYAGGYNEATQKGHVQGAFTSTATHTPVTGASTSKTRTSNYGKEFDLNIESTEWSLPTGTLGYYVDPSMATLNWGAIQGAVNAAQSGDTINANAGTYKEIVTIDRSLNVKGAGAGNTIIDGQKKGSVLTLNRANTDVTLSGISIIGGHAEYGGGIFNDARLTVKDSTISGNTATNGGAIYNNLGGVLNINDGTIIHDNTVIYNGGGIYSDGILNLNGGSIDHNTAMYGGGVFCWSLSSGTSVFNQNGGSISYNSAILGDDPRQPWVHGGYGGGVFADGINGIYNLNGGTVDNNVAASYGGGLYNSGTVTQNGGSIDHNKAVNAGGICNDEQGRVTLNAGSVDHNIANLAGGGIVNNGMLNLNGASISYNNAAFGGGIDTDGSLNLNSGSVDHNIANTHGGGILSAGTAIFNGGSISNNQATAGLGGGICFDAHSNPVVFNGPNIRLESNKAKLPSATGSSWYNGFGVYFISGTPTTKGGFNSVTQLKSNVLI